MDEFDKLKEQAKKIEERYISYPADKYLDGWADEIIAGSKNPLKFGFRKIDDSIVGGLKGMLCGFIGKGGTKKSLAAMNMLNKNLKYNLNLKQNLKKNHLYLKKNLQEN